MEFIKEYSITIITGLIFITIIFSIIPDNSMKKYVKFVLSLLLMSIFLSPIFSLVNKDLQVFNFESKLDYLLEDSKTDYKNYEINRIEETKKTFSENVNKLIKDSLIKEYGISNIIVNSKVDYNIKNKFVISNIYVKFKSNNVKKVDKVGSNVGNNEEEKEMIKYISSSFNIDKKLIIVEGE